MKKITIKTGLLLFSLCAFQVQAAANDASRLMDWAESTYPQFFPPSQPNQTLDNEWIYRYYPSTNNAVGIRFMDRVFIAGDSFGGLDVLTDVGSLPDLLVTAFGASNNNGGGSCVNAGILPVKIFNYKMTITDSAQPAGNDTAVMVIKVLESTASRVKTETTLTFSKNVQSNSTSVTTQNNTRTNGFIKISVIEATATTSVGNVTTKITNNPALRVSPLEICAGTTWQSNQVSQTVETIIPNIPIPTGLGGITTDIPPKTTTIHTVNESITVPAGTFLTYKTTSEGSTVWSVTEGFFVKQEVINGSQKTVTELTLIQ